MHTTRFNSTRDLAYVIIGFALTIVLLESQALLTWAQRLEVGFGRNAAVEAASAIHKTLAPLGIERLRQQGLADLDLLGWSDDPARLRTAQENASLVSPGRSCALPNALSLPDSTIAGGAPAAATRGNDVPIFHEVPKATLLPPLPPAVAGKPRVVALAGDSMMAVGLSNVLMQDAAANENLHVVKAFRSGTGLARPDIFNWMEEYPAMIADQQPDVVLVAIGANDGQGFVENGQVLAFGSDAWIKVYQQRTAAFLNLLTQHGAHVVWIGLPPMKSSKYEDKTEVINRIAYTVVSQYPQASWWNPQQLIADNAGAYREFATLANGKTTRIRAADGIHLSDEGAALLTPTLMSWLNPAPPTATAQVEAPPAQPKARSPRSPRTVRR
jgi:lysophospholipase L1-like esterase